MSDIIKNVFKNIDPEADKRIDEKINNLKKTIKMKKGNVYFLKLKGDNELIARYRNEKLYDYIFSSLAHYWGEEAAFNVEELPIRKGSVLSIREASKCEKMTLELLEKK